MGMSQVTYFKQFLVEVLMCASDKCIMHGRSSDPATYSVQMWYTEDYKPAQNEKIDIRECIRSRYQRFSQDSKT